MKTSVERAIRSIAVSVLLLIGAAGLEGKTPLYVYDFNLDLKPTARVDYLRGLGFRGLVTRLKNSADLRKLRVYADHVEPLHDFDVLAFVVYDFTDDEDANVWRRALPVLEKMGAPLWVIIRKAPSALAVDRLLAEMAHASHAYGVQTVIYPHWDTDIETAAEASAILDRLDHLNLKNSLHTCHEIRGGHQYDMEATVRESVAETALVTVAGADDNAYAGPNIGMVSWSDVIKPLDEGDYSILPFLQALQDSGFEGPVILHTFGIIDNPGHLERSIIQYDEYVESLVPAGG